MILTNHTKQPEWTHLLEKGNVTDSACYKTPVGLLIKSSPV